MNHQKRVGGVNESKREKETLTLVFYIPFVLRFNPSLFWSVARAPSSKKRHLVAIATTTQHCYIASPLLLAALLFAEGPAHQGFDRLPFSE